MEDFTDGYHSRTTIDLTNLPYWDLCAALRPCDKLSTWGLDAATERRMRERHALFVTQAQLDAAEGDTGTRLPPPLTRPAHWPGRRLA